MIAQNGLPAFTGRFAGFRQIRLAVAALVWLSLCVAGSSFGDVWISEFVADNQNGLRTKAGEFSDWIELANNGSEPANVGGWYLTDRDTALTKWRIPDNTIIQSNSFLVIFADSSLTSITNGELHANFSLSKGGEYLALVRPDGVTVASQFAPAFPPQLENISYGSGAPNERELVGPSTPLRYRIPNADGTAPWINATGALGFSRTNGSFATRYYEMNTSILNLDVAENMVANNAYWKTDTNYPIVGQYDLIDFFGTSLPGNFTNDFPFPNQAVVGEDKDDFVLVAEGAVTVPSPGMWTFAVGSDDGFRLRISGHGVDFVSEYTTARTFETSLATFNFPVAGSYNLRLIYYEDFGGSGLECSVAEDFQEVFSPDLFALIGDPASRVRHTGLIAPLVGTDVAVPMQNVNARLDAEWTFTMDAAPAPGDTITLFVRCADGFSATLNGIPIAALNAPTLLGWDSPATATRTSEEATKWLSYSIPTSLLTAGPNTLAITALNDSAADPDFLIAPRLVWRAGPSFAAYFKTPTPGAPNATAFSAPTPVVTAGEPRGYKTTPFTVSLTCSNTTAEIRYTLNGSTPTSNSAVYSSPLTVSQTTTLRAAVLDPTSVRQNVTTLSWLFLEDILRQGPTPPPGWPANREINNHIMEYGMRQEIVTGDPVRLRNGMTNAIPSISLVTDLPNLFNPQTGIYVNPGNDGIAWERPVSVELIDPVRGTNFEFHIDAGLRIRGAYSRSVNNPKHAFRLFFRADYSDKLRYPLFDREGASEFEKVDLRTSQNYSWSYENSTRDTFVRETFSRDSQRDMGMPYTRSRYYHLYINGQYWGLYQTQERGDADYAATYLGGNDEDWDCIKTSQPGYVTTASDGTFTGFYALHNLAINQGFTGAYANNYYRVRGLNPDGTSNPAYPAYVDQDNLIIYMLVALYTGDPDSPVSIWGGFPNNMYGLFNRVSPGGFKWLRHDAEHSLGAHGSYGVTADTTLAGSTFTTQGKFNPAILHQRLCQHPEYRARFADLVQKHLYGDGALTPTNAQQRFLSRMREIDFAIIGESARWGRGKTRDGTWLPACNEVLNTYLNQRRDIVISQFRVRGWFPSLDAPTYSIMNTQVVSGQVVRISGTSTFYYTTNGSDPRLPDGALNPAAITVPSDSNPTQPRLVFGRGADWRYFDLGSEPAPVGNLTWRDPGYPDQTWGHGPAIIGFAGSATANPVATATRRYVNGVSAPQVTTTYLRRTFTLSSTNDIPRLVCDMLRDDGVVIYLNGSEVPEWRDNMNPGTPTYDTYSANVVGSPAQNTYYTYPADAAHLLRVGTNTLAVEVHQCNSGSSDLYFDFSLTIPGSAGYAATNLTVTSDLTLKGRAFDGSNWSALSENVLTIQRPPPDYTKLRISEFLYAPPPPTPPSPYVNDDFAWLELRNSGPDPIDLEGVSFVTGITHTFAPLLLAPGARAVLCKNPAAFATRYATNNLKLVAWTSGNLARSGETISLVDPATNNILTFTYSRVWYPETYNTGFSLVAVDLAAAQALWSTPDNWRPGYVQFGTPGFAEPPALGAVRVTPEHTLLFDAIGLEGDTVQLWSSEDLNAWNPCDPSAWSRTDATFTIDLQHPSLANKPRCFFQMRIP